MAGSDGKQEDEWLRMSLLPIVELNMLLLAGF